MDQGVAKRSAGLGEKWLAGESACPTLKRVGNPLQDGILPHLLQLDGYGFDFGVLLQAVFA